MSVWSRDPETGEMAWKLIEAQYSTPYEETVFISVEDLGTGAVQTIRSNRIHPFFVQTERAVANASEGQVYSGPLENGHWVDAADLLPGDRLMNDDGSWSAVVSVDVSAEPLQAFNLTVAEFHTYFVAANDDAKPVWVHNTCLTAEQIAKGHTFKKHISEFHDLGITSQSEFADLISGVIKNPTHTGKLARGRAYWYDGVRNILVIKDPSSVDLGTAFRPKNGLSWVQKLR